MTQAPNEPKHAPPSPQEPGLDAAQQSLSDALRVSFGVLKVLMGVLLVVYIGSGLFRVDEQNTAVRYRFGEEIGTYGPGWHFGLPFPIENVVMVPRNTQTVRIDQSFWYDNPDDKDPDALAFETLDPLKDSFLITGDTNVIHVQFEVVYAIEEQDVDKYLRNVGSLELANELIRTAAERAMIHAIASAKIDDIVNSSKYPIQDIVRETREVLTDLDTGITVQQVLIDLKNQSMPNQVREAYNGVTQAQADKVKMIQEARRAYDETLGRAAGGAHRDLLTMIRAYEAALGSNHDELAKALRGLIDGSITSLNLPSADVLDAVRLYIATTRDAAGSDDDEAQVKADLAMSGLYELLKAIGPESNVGKPIAGEIAAAISRAKANRSQISTKARLDYERYASALEAYKKTPLVLANDRLQATREKVMTGLTLNVVGDITRVNTTPDPRDVEEVNNAEFERIREIEREKKQSGAGG